MKDLSSNLIFSFSIEAGQSIKVGEKMLCKVEIEKEKAI